MHPPLQANNMNLKHLKSLLLGTSAFVCLALAAPVSAADFTITSGATTNDGNTINGNDSVTVTGALVTTGVNEGIDTTGGTNTISVSEAGSIETAGGGAFGIFNNGGRNATVHILPNILGPLLVIMTVDLASAILLEATLSFLGIGLPADSPSLGTLIRIGMQFLLSGEWWILWIPTLVLVALVVSINILGDFLRDIFNPRLR